MPEVAQPPVNYPTSKRPNPSKFHHNNRCLLPFHNSRQPAGNKVITTIVAERKPGTFIKSNDGKFSYRIGLNGAVRKVPNQ